MIYTAATCSQTDVQAKVNLTVDGDTVNAPAGTATYASPLTVTKNISILGAGIGQTIIKSDLDTVFDITVGTNASLSRLAGFTFQPATVRSPTASTGFVQINGVSTVPNFRIDHIYFNNLYTQHIQLNGGLWGVIDHCRFDTDHFQGCIYPRHGSWKNVGANGDNSWADDPLFGTEKAIFIEDCGFDNFGAATMLDGAGGCRVVVRYSDISRSDLGNHGTESTQRTRGGRMFEIYNCNFTGEYPLPSYPVVNHGGGYPAGTMTMTVSAIVGAAAVGDTFTVQGESGSPIHTITAHTETGGNTTIISFSTAIASGGVTDGTGVIIKKAGAINNSGGYAAGTTTIAVKNFTGSVAGSTGIAPDNFIIAGEAQSPVHIISAHTETAGNTTSITFAPPLRGAVADSVTVTVTKWGPADGGNYDDRPIYIRSGTALIHHNAFIRYNSNAHFALYRRWGSFPPWGVADGANVWDSNDLTLFASGTQTLTATNSATLTDNTKTWTTDQWKGYCVRNLTAGKSSEITGNTATTLTQVDNPNGGPLRWNTGDAYEIRKVNIVLDQPCRGKGDLISGSGTPTPTIWPNQAREPIRVWSNTWVDRSNGTPAIAPDNNLIWTLGTDYFYSTDATAAQPGYTPFTYPHPLVSGLSNNTALSALAVTQGTISPAFSSTTFNYTDSVASGVGAIQVAPVTSDNTATVTVNGQFVAFNTFSQVINLNFGPNTITIVVTAPDGFTQQTTTLVVTRAGGSSNNLLNNLTSTAGAISPSFTPAQNNYSVSVSNGVASTTVTPTLQDLTASMTVNGTPVASGAASNNIALPVGLSIINIIVSAQNGSQRTYTLTVTRASASSNNADLSGLSCTAGALSPVFATGTPGYTVSTPNGTTTTTVTAVLSDGSASVKVNGVTVTSGSPSGAIALNVGSNVITVVVTAQDGITTKTYTITVSRAGSSNADLSSLIPSVGALVPAFAVNTLSYTDSVVNGTSTITVRPTSADANATITVNGVTVLSGVASGPISLAVGNTTITTVVTAQDTVATKTYTLVVTRAPSADANLANLVPSTGTISPTFAPATTSYTEGVANGVTTMTVTPTVEDATATVKVNGLGVTSGSASQSISLAVGTNTITILVTAQNGGTKTYTLTVSRSPSADLTALVPSAGALSPVFASGTLSYTVNVTNATATFSVRPTSADPLDNIKVNGVNVTSGSVSQVINLAVGANTITVLVTAEDLVTTKTYTVTVTRAASNVASLLSLVPGSGSLAPAFASGTFSYTETVANGTASMTFTPTAAGVGAMIKVNGVTVASGSPSGSLSLAVGANTVTIVVTAQDGITTATYTVIVSRAGSANADLISLTPSTGALAPVFASGTTIYTETVPNATASMTVTAILSDPTASLTVNGVSVPSGSASGAIALSIGSNSITVLVTAQDTVTTKTYTLNVTRSASGLSNDAALSSLSTSVSNLVPSFTGNNPNYSVGVSYLVSGIQLIPTVQESHATVTVNGTPVTSGTASGVITLAFGVNVINVVVTAQDGTTMTLYRVTVTRFPVGTGIFVPFFYGT